MTHSPRIKLENRVEESRAELRKTTVQLNVLMNATTDTIFLINLKGYVVAANAVTAERFGMRLDQFIGTCVYELMSPSLARSRRAKANRVVKSGKPHRFEDEQRGIVFDSTIYPVKKGRNSKDIAEMLGTFYKTIQNHRVNIRKKLGITKKPVNLRTYLSSLQ